MTAPIVGSPQTILFVIEKPNARAEVSLMLKDDGFTVLLASTPEEAIQISSDYAGTIDLLLTEAMMPEMSGPALARRLMQQRTTLRVLMITYYANGDLLVLNHGWHMVKGLAVAGVLREAVNATLHSSDGQPPDEFDTRTRCHTSGRQWSAN